MDWEPDPYEPRLSWLKTWALCVAVLLVPLGVGLARLVLGVTT